MSIERTKNPCVCTQCGAALDYVGWSKDRKCPYCGATYVTPVEVHKVDYLGPEYRRLEAKVNIPDYVLRYGKPEYTAQLIKEDLTKQLAEYLIPYLSYGIGISLDNVAELSQTIRAQLIVKLQDNDKSLEDILTEWMESRKIKNEGDK